VGGSLVSGFRARWSKGDEGFRTSHKSLVRVERNRWIANWPQDGPAQPHVSRYVMEGGVDVSRIPKLKEEKGGLEADIGTQLAAAFTIETLPACSFS
jgi:hypothetical protein